MSLVEPTLVSREDVIADPHMMGLWIQQQIKIRKIAKFEGCAIAKAEFGNNHPFSNTFINDLPEVQQFKNFKNQTNAKHKHHKDKTKKQYLNKLDKTLSKESLAKLSRAAESSADALQQLLASLD